MKLDFKIVNINFLCLQCDDQRAVFGPLGCRNFRKHIIQQLINIEAEVPNTLNESFPFRFLTGTEIKQV